MKIKGCCIKQSIERSVKHFLNLMQKFLLILELQSESSIVSSIELYIEISIDSSMELFLF